ncbi:MAG TPA: TonB-dependent receptor [Steroidobacteraceae bacterium]|nr:TonB-dependent receptor [Steroidobacteraceae bacterium]
MKRASLRRLNRKSVLHRKSVLQRKAVAVAVSSALMGLSGTAWGQAVTGTIQGTVPAAADEAIRITGGSGFDRTISVDPSGRYSTTVPVGTYTVSLLQNGKVVQSKTGVSPVAAGAVTVVFASATATTSTTELNTIVISARAIPAIDVSTTNQVTTVTAGDLQRLPLQRDAADIAALAPGVNMGSPQLSSGPLGNPINVFGGASTAENAYYIDGMNVTDALTAQGGLELPYGAIEEQQTLISGYGAKYGRSIGGVINQIGKSGNDDWHFGVRALVQPSSLQAGFKNSYYANPYATPKGFPPGLLHSYNTPEDSQETIYDAYVSGPIIKNKLFFFLAAEEDNTGQTTNDLSLGNSGSFENPVIAHDRTDAPKYYAKINWNINDNNLLTLTGLQSANKTWQTQYNVNYSPPSLGTFSGFGQTVKTTFRMGSANFTSYLTDHLTLDAMFGKTHGDYSVEQPEGPGFNASLPNIQSASNQDPRFTAPGGITNANTNSTQADPRHHVNVTSYRVSLNYKWRAHDISVGIDNINSWDLYDGIENTGPGYAYIYGASAPGQDVFVGVTPNVPPFVGPSDQCFNGTCYYVQQSFSRSAASVKVEQRAQYIEDNWHVTPDLLLSIGLRNDQFTNFDGSGVPYIKLTSPQWAPRVGFSWDVHGDSTFKVFGNAGRYYLALPLTTALSIASPVANYSIYGTYTGIDPATGAPTGFKPLYQLPATGVSIDSEYGQPKDPRISTAQNAKAEFSDNFVLGLQHEFDMLDEKWVAGATGTYQKMSRIIDDYDDEQRECAAGLAQGYQWMTPDTCNQWAQSLILINPGVTQHILMKAPDGSLVPVNFTPADQGFPRGVLRQYYSLDLSLTHVWNGRWSAKFDYVFSKTWGNTEGPVSTFSQQSGSYESITTAWDFPERMVNSYGVQPNDRRHQFKLFGAYGITRDLTVGANLYAASGTPRMCRGGYGPDQIALHGSHTYYFCAGVPVPPGSLGRLPWTTRLDLTMDYKPSFAHHNLDFNVAVFNVFNHQTPLFINDFFGTTANPNSEYGNVENFTPPRTVRLSVAYDY